MSGTPRKGSSNNLAGLGFTGGAAMRGPPSGSSLARVLLSVAAGVTLYICIGQLLGMNSVLFGVVDRVGMGVSTSGPSITEELNQPIGHHHPRIYVAELPEEYNTATSSGGKGFLEHPYGPWMADRGVIAVHGTADSPSQEWVVHHNMLRSPLRVADPAEADIVYVPFWAGAALRKARSKYEKGKHPKAFKIFDEFWDKFYTLVPTAVDKPTFMVLAQPEVEFVYGCGSKWRPGHCIDFACNPLARNVTFLVYESYHGNPHQPPWTWSDPYHDNTVTQTPTGKIHLKINQTFLSDPFDEEAALSSKRLVVTESFRSRFPLRRVLQDHCTARPDDCEHYEADRGSFNFNLTYVHDLTASSWFCNQPHGDTATRTQTFDCIGAGSIPVFFDPNAPFFMPYSDIIDWREATVVIAKEQLVGQDGAAEEGVNEVDLLKAVPQERRLQMLRLIYDLRHLVQYSFKPSQQLIRYDTMWSIHPLDDAFTGSMKQMLRNMCGRGLLPQGNCPQKPAVLPFKADDD